MGIFEDLTCRFGKESELSLHILHMCHVFATLRYFFLDSGKLDPEDVIKTYPRLNPAFSKAVRLG
jgi:hypothetical protein